MMFNFFIIAQIFICTDSSRLPENALTYQKPLLIDHGENPSVLASDNPASSTKIQPAILDMPIDTPLHDHVSDLLLAASQSVETVPLATEEEYTYAEITEELGVVEANDTSNLPAANNESLISRLNKFCCGCLGSN